MLNIETKSVENGTVLRSNDRINVPFLIKGKSAERRVRSRAMDRRQKKGGGAVAANLLSMKGGRFLAVMNKLGEALPAKVGDAILDADDREDALKEIVEAINALPRFALVHGVYTRRGDLFENFIERCKEKGIDLARFSWLGFPAAIPHFDPNDPETVVVLDATLGTLRETFEFAWQWAKDGQEDSGRSNRMISPAKIRLLSDERPDDAEGDGPDFTPWTLSWRRIKLDTNVGRRPFDVRDPKSPGCALLFMAAEHPKRIKAMDRKKRLGFWLPGLWCMAPDDRVWRSVPYVDFSFNCHGLWLDSDAGCCSRDDLAIPSFRE
ncbi:MAG TPA: hypothetical protein VFQ60_01065 [Patescibacteria group bacterium]|nr:hypothetical protein [Patescibacteria group bacterium]